MKIFTLIILIVAACSCTSKTLHLEEINNTPKNEGVYNGSFLIQKWMYKGTEQDYHYFQYTYTVGNFPKYVDYKIPANELTIPFQMNYSKENKDWIPVEYSTESKIPKLKKITQN